MISFTRRSSISISLLLWLVFACLNAAQAQTISSLSATTLPRAGRLKITGSGFGATQGSSLVTIGGAAAPASTWSNTSITAYVSDSSALGVDQVQVLTGGGDSNMVPLTVTARQAAGQVAWRFQADSFYIQGRPGIGPDGTIYALDVSAHLYALTPSGGVKWIFNSSPGVAVQSVDVGPDGTVYFGSLNTVYAVNPDGTLKWKVSDPSGGQMGAGPSVGPDGNIYAVTQDGGLPSGLGEMTLSPAGQVLSHRPGYVTGRGAEFLTREIAFGVNQFYFDMNNALDNNNGLQFFELGGNFLFARLAGGKDEQPAVDAGGNIYSSIASNELGVFDTSGNLLRSSILGSLTAPNVGSDSTIYVGANSDILALNPDLSVKWRHAIGSGYLGGGPVVNSSNSLLVVGVNDIGAPSFVQGIDAATGQLSWQVNLPAENGGFVRPMSRPRFSGAKRVYMGMDVNDGAADVYTYLYAINTAPTVTLSSLTLNPTTVKGGTPSQGTVTLTGKAPVGGAKVKLGSSNTAVATVPAMLTVPANASSATFTVTTKGVSGNTKVTISASYAGVRKNATLTVTP
jgi:IPT/TIG domain/PQQ-like domain